MARYVALWIALPPPVEPSSSITSARDQLLMVTDLQRCENASAGAKFQEVRGVPACHSWFWTLLARSKAVNAAGLGMGFGGRWPLGLGHRVGRTVG